MESNDEYKKVFGTLDDDQSKIEIRDKKMTDCFRRVFCGSNDGKIVLHQILTDLKFFDTCKDDADVALNNYAKFMIFQRLKANNNDQIRKIIYAVLSEIGVNNGN
ncbi:MAG: hypothetical protein J6S85_01775 [Methanobrevibacter sp.]|nr:hypothetical protein [Methanobrevibacter sp.]MBO7712264.1 hypothetical protein [Methanobrevibacter sp.]